MKLLLVFFAVIGLASIVLIEINRGNAAYSEKISMQL